MNGPNNTVWIGPIIMFIEMIIDSWNGGYASLVAFPKESGAKEELLREANEGNSNPNPDVAAHITECHFGLRRSEEKEYWIFQW